MFQFLLGDFKKVFAKFDILVKQRPVAGNSKQMQNIDTEDIAFMLFELENGAVGSMEATKIATGANDEIRVEIHGENGAIRFNTMQPNYLEVYDTKDIEEPVGGMRGFKAIETVQRYPDPAIKFPGPRFPVGWLRYHMGNTYDFVNNIIENKTPDANIYAGYKVQEVIEAATISDRDKRKFKMNNSL